MLALVVVGTLWGCAYAGRCGAFSSGTSALGEEPRIALHLARGDGFRSPFDMGPHAPPTSWSPPLYPALMALAYRVLGSESRPAMAAMIILNAICFALVAGALHVLGTRLVNRTTGFISWALFLGHPIFLNRISYLWDAYPALAMFCWTLVWVTSKRGRRQLGITAAVTLGVVLGWLALTNCAYILTYPVLLWIAARDHTFRRRAVLIATATLGFSLSMAPWTARNYVVFGRLFFVRGGTPLELWIGNHDNSSGITEDVVDSHPFLLARERAKVLQWGEPAYFDDCSRRFTEECKQRPGRFVKLSMLRAAYLLLYDPSREVDDPIHPRRSLWRNYPLSVGVNDADTMLGLSGCYLAWRLRDRRVLTAIGLGVLAVIPYVPAHVDGRYSMPLKALFLVPAAMVLSAISGWVRQWT